ncbi:AraC family transcriptional regulator [Paenibacillus baekrokdamisoli]|uniref:AraC family transcriptional regulator n=1 Tax=Paenibacillus baekrokdamisoli TaxID=1712516 RepID=A0A3G9J9F1_9BACL|nr:AraC family transcriptional regulator [Paenibacillus baekrokdamisoli]MBB3069442.1 AraC-like DNA-binding protein [Paenibacillus baekrokdamisoli]BBH24985.1 AraC family transcriptional regulator [Paenibacillus baekrokdamisoli]
MLHCAPSSFTLMSAFAKIVCEPGWKWQKREKPMANYDLFYVWSGEGELLLNGEPFPLGKGSCFLFRPGDFTSATHNPQKPLVLTYIHFAITEPVDKVPQSYRVLNETVDFEHLLSRYVRLFLVKTFAAEEEAQLILKQLMIYLLREDLEGPVEERKASNQLTEAIHEIANFIRQNPGVPHRVEDLAQRAHLSPRYFSIKFKEIIGTSVQTYMIRMRIDRAQHLLMHAGMNVTEVADALGYRDIFFFSRQFKQYTGKSPSEIR